ncbi:adhesion G protein-coupled receptor B2 [Trichonephila clavipes]|nr:adhesion G protein-coupled receptor B2 [Trichonephila clavipes]
MWISFTPNAAVLFVDVAIQPEVRFIAKQNSLMKIGNNGNLVLGPFDESTPCLMIVLMNCQTKLRINYLTAVKSIVWEIAENARLPPTEAFPADRRFYEEHSGGLRKPGWLSQISTDPNWFMVHRMWRRRFEQGNVASFSKSSKWSLKVVWKFGQGMSTQLLSSSLDRSAKLQNPPPVVSA